MKVLILSCTAGEGHNSAAKAIKEVYDQSGEYCEIQNALEFISKTLSNFVAKSHIILYRHFPSWFNFGYTCCENNPSILAPGSLVYKIFAKGTESLYKYISNNGFDTVICTHSFAAVIVTEIVNHYNLKIQTGFVATDFTCHPGTKDSDLDFYFIPDEKLVDDFTCDHIQKEEVLPFGIPIRQRFYEHIDKTTAKTEFGIPSDRKHVVMMCGSMGCGPLAKLALEFAKTMPECEFSVICGNNAKLKKSLDRKSRNIRNLHIFGFMNDMPKVLDSADLYLTKPGGISTSEAVAKEVPMLFVNTVAACESYNLKHFLSYGVADSGKNVKELTEKCVDIIQNEEKLEAFKQNLKNMPKVNSSEQIRQTMLNAKNKERDA